MPYVKPCLWFGLSVLVACTPVSTCPVVAPASVQAAEKIAAPVAPPSAPSEPSQTANEAVSISGAPAVPQELHERLLQYQNMRAANLADLTPDGKAMLIRTRFGETGQAHFVAMPMGVRKQLTFFDEPVADARFDPDDANALFVMHDLGGNEDHQIYRHDLKNGRSILLTDGKSRHQTLVSSRDGKLIAYTSNARNGRDMDVYVADGQSRDSEKRVLEVSGSYEVVEFSRDAAKLVLLEFVSILDIRVHVLDLKTNQARSITSPSLKASHRLARFDKTGQKLFVASDREGDHVELYEVNIASTEPTWKPLTRDIPWDIEGASLSPDGNTLAFATNEDGYSVLHLLDVRTGKHSPVRGLPKGVVSGFGYARAADVLGLSIAGATATFDAYTYDLKKKKLTRFTESEMGGLDAASFIEPELVRVRSFDGLEVPIFVTRPRGTGPFPVVIDIHGGPESQARPWFRPFAQYLAVELGIATIAPNVRGSDGYGKAYLALDNGTKREDSVKDIGAVLDFIASDQGLDEGRVAVMGGSYGGYMTLASLVHYGKRIKGGIDFVGIANFVSFLENTRDYRRDLRRVEYGDESDPEMRKFLTQISPLTQVDKIESALFVAHGKNDPRVPIGEAEQIAKAVRDRGREVWTMVANNEGHGFNKKANRDLQTELCVLFLERVLLGKKTE